MKKKIIIIISVLIAIPILVWGIIFIVNEIRIKNAVIEIELNIDRTVEFLAEVKVSNYIKSINGQIVDDYLIDTTKVGKKKINYEYINDDGIRLKQSYDLEVIDGIPPVIWLNSSYTVTKGSNISLTEKIMCGDNYDDKPICTIEGDYDLNQVGTYPLTYKAIDSSGNIAEKNFNLIVKESKKNNSSNSNTSTSSSSTTEFSDVVEKYKNENTQIGLDISKWQGDVDFEKLKEAGVEFVILRVGTSKGINEDSVLDSKFIENITAANEVGIPVGIYYYSYANSKKRAVEEAKWVIEQIKDYQIDLEIAFDWENWSSYNKYNLSFYNLTQTAKAYLDTLKDAGYSGLLYSSKTYLDNIWYDTGYNIWLAHYTKKTSYEGSFTYWQMCNNGRVSGINGDVDIDIRYLDK
jgi:GH25 family lysozyme M1 (1,4-beta-N-acetylmuramidase)